MKNENLNNSEYKRVLTVQDISCVGQCSLTVALPILSACGLETAVLPSAVLSTHTGGFTGYTFRDLTDDMPKIREHWICEKLYFSAIYTGYLGSARQIEYVKDIARDLLEEGAPLIVDPAMADNGKLYYGFDAAFVGEMKKLVDSADIILPNITEACFLTGAEYKETYDESYVRELCDALDGGGKRVVVLTGVGYREGETGVSVRIDGRDLHYPHRRIEPGSHGTGDVFASAFVGAYMRGMSAFDSASVAADFTLSCIIETQRHPGHTYGATFEPKLGELAARLGLISAD